MSQIETATQSPARWGLALVRFLAMSAAILWVAYLFDLSEQLSMQKDLQRDISDLRTEYAQKRSQLAHLGLYQEQMEKMKLEYQSVIVQLPDNLDHQEVHQYFAKLEDANTAIHSFAFEEERKRGFYAEKAYTVVLDTDYQGVFNTIEQLYNNNPIASIASLSVKPYGKSLRARFEVDFYRYLREEEQ